MCDKTEDANAELTVIIVSYNTRELTLKALSTLFENTHKTDMDVVVIDNASADGSAEAISKQFPQANLIQSKENLGFAKANNVVAANVKSEWLLLLNPDTEVHDSAVDNLLDFARSNPEAGIYGGRTVFPDGSLNSASCWMKITPWSAFCNAFGLSAIFKNSETFNSEAMGGWRRDSVRKVDIVVGCFFLIPKSLWDQLGGFDLKYYMYGEESDLCLRAARMGYQPMITPEAEIMHIVGAASKTQGGKLVLVAKARVTLIRDHWNRSLVPIGLLLMWSWSAVRLIGFTMLNIINNNNISRQKLRAWREVWEARHQWLKGY